MNWRILLPSIFLTLPNRLYAVNYGKAMQHYNNNHDIAGEMLDFAFITLGLVVVIGGAIWFMKRND